MKWGRFGVFLVLVVAIFGLTAGTSMKLWRSIPLGLDLKGGFELLYEVEPTPSKPLTKDGIQAALEAVQMRVNSIGTTSPNIELENHNYIRVDMAGTFDQSNAENVIGETALLEMYGTVKTAKNGQVTPEGTPLLTGNDLKSNAHWEQDPQTGQNEVALTFKDPKKWQDITTKYTGKPIYIFLNGKLLMNPVVNGPIPNGQTVIYGGNLSSQQQCQDFAKALNSGALPYPLVRVSSLNVGPSLGAASLKATMYAGLIAVILIFLFMLIMYRMAGLIANIALVAYGYLTVLTFAGLHITLTLSGLAALVLGVGIAVDANIITYERVKDEVRLGRSLQSAVLNGNRRSFRTIIDANTTTFIAGAVMYWFGQGDIRGFAVALMASIIISLLTAVLLSRAMLISFTKSNIVRRPWWFGAGKGVVNR